MRNSSIYVDVFLRVWTLQNACMDNSNTCMGTISTQPISARPLGNIRARDNDTDTAKSNACRKIYAMSRMRECKNATESTDCKINTRANA